VQSSSKWAVSQADGFVETASANHRKFSYHYVPDKMLMQLDKVIDFTKDCSTIQECCECSVAKKNFW